MSTSFRAICLDVGDESDAVATSALTRAVALSSSKDKLLCFGRAAALAGRLDRQERAEREGIWLESAAQWLLAADAVADPPQRPQPGPLQALAVGVTRAGADTGHLQATDRLVELAGSLLIMAVPSGAGVDAPDNAHVWLVGGEPFGVSVEDSTESGRVRVGVKGSIVDIDVSGNELQLRVLSLQGALVSELRLRLGKSKMSVRSATA
jgi:hypothetical protein